MDNLVPKLKFMLKKKEKYEFSFIYKIKGEDQGQKAWYILQVDKNKRDRYMAAIQRTNDNIINLEDYGKVLYCAYGETIPQEILVQLHSQFHMRAVIKSLEYNKLGYEELKNNNYEKAILYFTKSIELSDIDEISFNNRGFCYWQIKDVEKAKKDLFQSIKLNRNLSNPYKHLSKIYFDEKNYLEAQLYCQKALSLGPDNDDRQQLNRLQEQIQNKIGKQNPKSNNKQYIQRIMYKKQNDKTRQQNLGRKQCQLNLKVRKEIKLNEQNYNQKDQNLQEQIEEDIFQEQINVFNGFDNSKTKKIKSSQKLKEKQKNNNEQLEEFNHFNINKEYRDDQNIQRFKIEDQNKQNHHNYLNQGNKMEQNLINFQRSYVQSQELVDYIDNQNYIQTVNNKISIKQKYNPNNNQELDLIDESFTNEDQFGKQTKMFQKYLQSMQQKEKKDQKKKDDYQGQQQKEQSYEAENYYQQKQLQQKDSNNTFENKQILCKQQNKNHFLEFSKEKQQSNQQNYQLKQQWEIQNIDNYKFANLSFQQIKEIEILEQKIQGKNQE
ncbi:hypothetical protein PPERSA_11342 [Pseudocohnilembus persalinus]|uniref:Uncharacterized protein n=1 Tax=Pseudocohnilembus persalinus TaxID=266149 RepID=A0A0V0QQB3_PSEPJ|nr:hypothetical protein PPERSA_11342 [Pseudocohnilembus persalinus]|eukprot:KRX04218.1 hypothetical protein PPERSA_11342 [Pseudocohnilembus persalinus]